MKKVVFVLIAILAFNAQAQKGNGNRANMTPEEMASTRTKQMTIDLDLTEAQQAEVLAINMANAESLGKLRGKRRSDLSEAERNALRSTMRETQEKTKKEFEKILTAEQYAKWDKMQKERMEKARNQRRSTQ